MPYYYLRNAKYVCSICGFVYDESIGNPESGIAPGTKWEDVPPDWVCPLCGATKSEFEKEKTNIVTTSTEISEDSNSIEQMKELSFGALSALCSNLSKGCKNSIAPKRPIYLTSYLNIIKVKVVPWRKISSLT